MWVHPLTVVNAVCHSNNNLRLKNKVIAPTFRCILVLIVFFQTEVEITGFISYKAFT